MSLKDLGYVISPNGAVTTDLLKNRILRTENLNPETAYSSASSKLPGIMENE